MPSEDEPPWESGWLAETHQFASRCATFRDTNPYKRPALEEIMIYLATELWDRRFSQSEIRSAFESALKGLPPYAAGGERRGDRE